MQLAAGTHSGFTALLVGLSLLTSAAAQQEPEPLPEQGAGVSPDMVRPTGADEHEEEGTMSWSVRLGFYDRDDPNGAEGNPFLDESLTVIEPIVIFDYQVSQDFGYELKFSYDRVSSASIDRLSKFDGQSGASGDNYLSIDAAFRHRLTEADDLSWHVGIADEYDYSSLGLGAGWSQAYSQRDAVLNVNLNTYFDDVTPIRFDGTEEDSESRISVAGTIGLYQAFSPTLHGEFGLTVSAQSGFLETPYNAVVVLDPTDPPNPNLPNMDRGTEYVEVLPDSRNRYAIFGRARKLVWERSAFELGSRLYSDDWGITAIDLTPRYLHQFEGGSLLDVRYRFYTQSGADAWAETFTTLPEERTQDSDLGEFDSHLIGMRYIWGGGGVTWDVGLDYLSRSDGLDHYFVSAGWNWEF